MTEHLLEGDTVRITDGSGERDLRLCGSGPAAVASGGVVSVEFAESTCGAIHGECEFRVCIAATCLPTSVRFTIDTQRGGLSCRVTDSTVHGEDMLWTGTAEILHCEDGIPHYHASLLYVTGARTTGVPMGKPVVSPQGGTPVRLPGGDHIAANRMFEGTYIAVDKRRPRGGAAEGAEGDGVTPPTNEVLARVYGAFDYPEQGADGEGLRRRTANSGVCFSGGGMRAYCSTWGQLRALHHLGLLPKTRYISGVSGGNWGASVYTFRDRSMCSDTDFLGPILFNTQNGGSQPPMTDAVLEEIRPHCMGSVALHEDVTMTANVVRHLFPLPGSDPRNGASTAWNLAVEDRILSPFGIDGKKVVAHSSSDVQRHVSRSGGALRQEDFIVPNQDTPFLVTSTVMMSPSSLAPTPSACLRSELHLFESTPLSCGVPTPLRQEDYHRGGVSHNRRVFGGTVEPIGHCGTLSESGAPCGHEVRAVDSVQRYTLSETVGTSSSFFAGLLSHAVVDRFLPRHVYTPGPRCMADDDDAVLLGEDGTSPTHAKSEEFVFGDGGLLDNPGLLSMVRRQVKDIVVMVNTSTPLSCLRSFPHQQSPASHGECAANGFFLTEEMLSGLQGACPETPNGDAAIDMFLAAYFGFETPVGLSGAVAEGIQVFQSDKLWDVVDQLQRRASRNEPLVARCDGLEVLQNDKHGVRPYHCNLTVVYLGMPLPAVGDAEESEEAARLRRAHRTSGFNRHLSDEVYRKVHSRSSEFENFPNYHTFNNDSIAVVPGVLEFSTPCGYSAKEANILSQLTSWTLLEYLQHDPEGRELFERLGGADSRLGSARSAPSFFHSAVGAAQASAQSLVRCAKALEARHAVLAAVVAMWATYAYYCFTAEAGAEALEEL
eukprot:TRINITY_DN7957_c0_g1_i1.p1 TRINITY_DN7957_c0_g1~~TRINITY_DN7957_c0_g1_i1.p1  ORF type:complete len:886 (+),score=312.20 TRINITY_DN7957_c0_g1_i1:84-2741(+)